MTASPDLDQILTAPNDPTVSREACASLDKTDSLGQQPVLT
ncbi:MULTISPECIES: hypothetical protein [unclassified Pseudomonas]|nr:MULTISPECIES: hypothetical protein [unclassified Pseudomonas]WLH69638.1 hypothetical protein PSH59_05840 [Pseudomonas sp. FP2309]